MDQLRTFFFCPEVEAISFYLLRNWAIAGISNLSLASIFKTMNISIYCKWVHTLLPNYRCSVQIIPGRWKTFYPRRLIPLHHLPVRRPFHCSCQLFCKDQLEKLSCRCLDPMLSCVLICSAKRNIRIAGNWSDGSPGEFPSYRLFASHFMKSRSNIQRLFDF